MQEEMQEFTSEQSKLTEQFLRQTVRLTRLSQRGADQKDTQLDISERAQALSEAYKLGMLSIERLVANATKSW